jgi:HEAT repeat protein
MSPLAVFLRTLSRSSAIVLGIAFVVINPSLEWSTRGMRSATAQNSDVERAVDALVAALKDSDAGVRRQATVALGQMKNRRACRSILTSTSNRSCTPARESHRAST